jgi:hypothetical protein
MDQLAGALPLVAADGRPRIESGELGETLPAQHEADRRDRPAEAARNRRAGEALAAQGRDLGVEPSGAEARPRAAIAKPGLALCRKAVAPLRSVRGSTPKADATDATLHPEESRSTISIRLRLVVPAF